MAQYVREAGLARLMYAASKRGDEEFELALEIAQSAEPATSEGRAVSPATLGAD